MGVLKLIQNKQRYHGRFGPPSLFKRISNVLRGRTAHPNDEWIRVRDREEKAAFAKQKSKARK